VAAYSAEAEGMAAYQATKEALWLMKLMISFDLGSEIFIQMHSANQAAIAVMKIPSSHHRVEQIKIQHRFVRDAGQRGEVKHDCAASKMRIAGKLANALPSGQLERAIGALAY
jgi:hypothetical protein